MYFCTMICSDLRHEKMIRGNVFFEAFLSKKTFGDFVGNVSTSTNSTYSCSFTFTDEGNASGFPDSKAQRECFAEYYDFSSITLSTKQDFESGYHYFGARYFDSEALTGWLSVDPMSDKYPGISPYAYCAWNPVKLVDPDGMEVVAYTKETEKKILGYMENLFGASSMFRFNKNGSLKINRKEFSNYYKTSTNDQKKILKGIDQAIRARKTVTINIQENNSKFIWKGINEEFAVDCTLDLKNNSGCTSSKYYPVLGHIISINDRDKNASSLSAGINENGEKETIVPPTSTTFVHELLDEFLNFFVTGITNENSPNVDKVDYQNTALRILGLKERDGSDHCY